ncbi:MAG: type II toxin-antitoxin system RelE/ParE family toxin [Nitrospirae bacterium]|nr:type II toxin-antitoxin system RelE/ParE family toxin [Nitrospirota bacterium]
MPYELRYHSDVRDVDIPQLNHTLRNRIRKAVEQRLTISPHQYGEPLRKTLKGYWKLHVGDYRVVLKIERNEILILVIINRKDIYKKIFERPKF